MGDTIEYYFRKHFEGMRDNILERDSFQCQECGMIREQHLEIFGMDITIDHIDGNETNNCSENLKTLCFRCHGKKDGGRGKHWELSKEICKKRLGSTNGFKVGHPVSQELRDKNSKRLKGKTYGEIYGEEKARTKKLKFKETFKKKRMLKEVKI